MRFHAVNTAIV